MKEIEIEPNFTVRSLTFWPDTTYLASGSVDNIIRLWHLETRTETRRFEGHTDVVLSVSVSRDGQRLLSSSRDHTIRQWRVGAGEEIRQLKGHTRGVKSAVHSVDERHIFSCSDDGTIQARYGNIESDVYIPEIGKSLYSLGLEDGWIRSKTGSSFYGFRPNIATDSKILARDASPQMLLGVRLGLIASG